MVAQRWSSVIACLVLALAPVAGSRAGSAALAVSVTVVDRCRVAETVRCNGTQPVVVTAAPSPRTEVTPTGQRRQVVHF